MQTHVIILDSEQRREHTLMVLSSLNIERPWKVEIQPYKETRSDQQNKRYWALLGLIEDKTGHDKDELHDFFKEMMLGTREIEIAGERKTVRPSTRRLKTDDFHAYMVKCETWAIEKLDVWLAG